MRKKRHTAALVLTVLVMVIVVLVARRSRPPPESDSGTEPGDCLTAVLIAAERGDVPRYLDCFSGDLRKKLEAEASASRPPERFAEALRASVADLKGSVTTDVELHGTDRAVLRWERIYAQHVEHYRVELHRLNGRWRIARLDRLDRRAPEIPYGTPVFPEVETPPDEETGAGDAETTRKPEAPPAKPESPAPPPDG